MKNVIKVFLIIVICLGLTGCAGEDDGLTAEQKETIEKNKELKEKYDKQTKEQRKANEQFQDMYDSIKSK